MIKKRHLLHIILMILITFITSCQLKDSDTIHTQTTTDCSNQTTTTTEKELPPLHKPDPISLVGYQDAPVYEGLIPNEKPKPETPNCFQGAWYRKVVSSKDNWLGIEAVLTLPEFQPDEARRDPSKPRYLDNPSIYFGGNASFESDVGLTWTLGCSNAFCLVPSTEAVAFRPFWRYIDNGQNIYANSNFRHPEWFYLPGDTLRISVFSPRPDFLQMQIEVIEASSIPKYVEVRKTWRIENNQPADYITPEFPSKGHGSLQAEFKRVNAIDQVGNEGKPTQPTNTIITEAIYHEVYLYRKIDGTIYKIPFTKDRYASMTCPNKDGFTISYEGIDRTKGGEIIRIHPGTVNK